MIYAAMVVQFFDSEDPEWGKGNANWVVENTEVLAQQTSLVSIGAASELSSWAGSFEVAEDGSMILIKAWHMDSAGQVQTGLPPVEGSEPDAEPEPGSEPEPEGFPAWTEWDNNNENLYQIGDRVSHNGSNWEAINGDNHWEPGVFGWTQI